jgi:hypothetical protein
MRNQPAGRPLRTAGWAITVLVAVVSAVYLAQQIHLIGG